MFGGFLTAVFTQWHSDKTIFIFKALLAIMPTTITFLFIGGVLFFERLYIDNNGLEQKKFLRKKTIQWQSITEVKYKKNQGNKPFETVTLFESNGEHIQINTYYRKFEELEVFMKRMLSEICQIDYNKIKKEEYAKKVNPFFFFYVPMERYGQHLFCAMIFFISIPITIHFIYQLFTKGFFFGF
jgi:hypothetical protein